MVAPRMSQRQGVNRNQIEFIDLITDHKNGLKNFIVWPFTNLRIPGKK